MPMSTPRISRRARFGDRFVGSREKTNKTDSGPPAAEAGLDKGDVRHLRIGDRSPGYRELYCLAKVVPVSILSSPARPNASEKLARQDLGRATWYPRARPQRVGSGPPCLRP